MTGVVFKFEKEASSEDASKEKKRLPVVEIRRHSLSISSHQDWLKDIFEISHCLSRNLGHQEWRLNRAQSKLLPPSSSSPVNTSSSTSMPSSLPSSIALTTPSNPSSTLPSAHSHEDLKPSGKYVMEDVHKVKDINARLKGIQPKVHSSDAISGGYIIGEIKHVGGNVGDCAARGADLFESIAAEIISAMILSGTMAQHGKIAGKLVFKLI
ncbi:hypothetical protein JHK85_056009 [Glycine max]|nr:hypothetical protein JHK85_056009 [Glycine max]